MSERSLVIGLAGGTGSGKTTVAKALLAEAGSDNALLLPQDAYYRAQGDLPFEARVLTNYDEPSAFDSELLVDHVDRLVSGESVERPVYDFTVHDRSPNTLYLEPKPVIIVEGILVLHDQHLRERMQLKVFVDAPPDERFIRRLERDVEERGRSAQAVIAQYRRTVKPMHDLFIEPTKQYADLVLPEGGKNRVALEVLVDHVDAYLRRSGRGRA